VTARSGSRKAHVDQRLQFPPPSCTLEASVASDGDQIDARIEH
jgi:hypothetical protein